MKSKSKLILGIVLITGVIVLCYMGVTTTLANPPVQDGDDPGNSTGPGFGEVIPPDETFFEFNVFKFLELNSLN